MKTKTVILLIIILSLLVLSIQTGITSIGEDQFSSNTIINVPGDYPYISWAVSNATDNDIIVVDAGLYTGVEPYQIILDKPIKIMGINGTPIIKSLPDMEMPVSTTLFIPRIAPSQLPSITIENIAFNITTVLHNVTTFMYLDGLGSYEIKLINVSFTGSPTYLPNLTDTILATDTPYLLLENVTDKMPGSIKILYLDNVEISNTTRIGNKELLIQYVGSAYVHDTQIIEGQGLSILYVPSIHLDNLLFKNNTANRAGILTLLAYNSNNYNIVLGNITFENNNWGSMTVASDLALLTAGSLPVNSLYLQLNNISFTSEHSTTYMIPLSLYLTGAQENTQVVIKDIDIQGHYFRPWQLQKMVNTTISNLTIKADLDQVGPASSIEGNNITIQGLNIEKGGLYFYNATVKLIEPRIRPGSLQAENSHLELWSPIISPDKTIPFLNAQNTTISIYNMQIYPITMNLTIGADALGSTYSLYHISLQNVPVKPPTTVIVAPLIKIDTINAFNISFNIRYNTTLLEELGIKENLLGILKHDGTSWKKPSMTGYSHDMVNQTINFTLRNAGDPIIVLYSYPVIVGGELITPTKTSTVPIIIVLGITLIGVYAYTIMRKIRQ